MAYAVVTCYVYTTQPYNSHNAIKATYSPTVHDSSKQSDTQYNYSTSLSITIVQNRAMRTILNRPPSTHSQPLRTELNWRSLYERRQLRSGISTFKCLNKLSPPYLHNLFQRNPASRGRNKDKLFLIRPLTNWVKHSFSYKSAKLWNTLSRDTIDNLTLSLDLQLITGILGSSVLYYIIEF